jgi:hypothetical protein
MAEADAACGVPSYVNVPPVALTTGVALLMTTVVVADAAV